MSPETTKRINEYRRMVANNEYSKVSWKGIPLPEEYKTAMTQLGEKYQNVRWLPLDIPKIELGPVDSFKDFWEKESIDVLRIKPDVAEPFTKELHPLKENSSWHVPSFKGLTLYRHPKSVDAGTFVSKVYNGDNAQMKKLVEQAFDYFPMHTMMEVFIWQSTREIRPHQDQSAFWKCPTEFRSMLHDENDTPTLWTADIKHGDIHYVDPPADTNSFCWSNGTQIHGSDYHGKKKWLLVVSGIQHSAKSDALFERSISKYRDQLNYELDYGQSNS
jgi:hypothetical protein